VLEQGDAGAAEMVITELAELLGEDHERVARARAMLLGVQAHHTRELERV
jgi:hypothetical protein